jgi:hypothetical protein
MVIILDIVYHLGSFFKHNSWVTWSNSVISYGEGICLLETDFIGTMVLFYRRQENGEISN